MLLTQVADRIPIIDRYSRCLRIFQEACRRVSVGRVKVPGQLRGEMLRAARQGRQLISVRQATPSESREFKNGRPAWVVEPSELVTRLLNEYRAHAGRREKSA